MSTLSQANRFVGGFTLLLFLQWLGEGIRLYFALRVPGPVIGMLLLLLLLLAFNPLHRTVEPAASLLLKHLSLFFFPALMSAVLGWQAWQAQWPIIATAMVLGTAIALPVVGWLFYKTGGKA